MLRAGPLGAEVMRGKTFGQSERVSMEKREIVDCLGRSTGERIARYIWRSKPTRDPIIDRPVRCVVAQDEKGQYWAATRIGRGNGQKSQTEFWESFETKERAVAISRNQTRAFLSTQAESYSNTATDKKPGEKIVEITMDDGWSVAVNAPGKISPAEQRAMEMLDRIGKGKQTRPKAPARRGDREWPSR
jgi:hypothetical protein